jgi:hypothetical protein
MITVQLISFKGYGFVIWFRGCSPNPIIKDKTRGICVRIYSFKVNALKPAMSTEDVAILCLESQQ